MHTCLQAILGGDTAEAVLLHLYHHGETHGRAVASDLEVSRSMAQRKLRQYEEEGLLVSKMHGRTRVYQWNPRSALASRLRDLVAVAYDGIPLDRRQEIFRVRRRPLAAGKPVMRGRQETK